MLNLSNLLRHRQLVHLREHPDSLTRESAAVGSDYAARRERIARMSAGTNPVLWPHQVATLSQRLE
jgi:hypothetical protein